MARYTWKFFRSFLLLFVLSFFCLCTKGFYIHTHIVHAQPILYTEHMVREKKSFIRYVRWQFFEESSELNFYHNEEDIFKMLLKILPRNLPAHLVRYHYFSIYKFFIKCTQKLSSYHHYWLSYIDLFLKISFISFHFYWIEIENL